MRSIIMAVILLAIGTLIMIQRDVYNVLLINEYMGLAIACLVSLSAGFSFLLSILIDSINILRDEGIHN